MSECTESPGPKAMLWRLYLLVALAILALGYREFLASSYEALWITQYAGYWLVAAMALLFVMILHGEIRARWPGWRNLRPHWPGLLVAILGMCFWQVHEPHSFKVLFDEHVLGGIARDMHFDRTGSYPFMLHLVDGHLETVGHVVDKRPLMFPFLVSVLHDLTGYRPMNSFIVNGALSFVLLIFTYGIGAIAGGWRIGCFGQFLLLGLPLLAQSATGGGFDLLNATMLCGFVIVAWNYWVQPATGGLNLLVFTALFLANCRYESMAYIGVVGLLVLLKWIRERRLSLTLAAALSPPLVLPPMLINLIFFSNEGYMQTTRDNFMATKYIPENFGHAVYFLFTPDFDLNNSVLLSVVGVVAILFTLVGVGLRLRVNFREPGIGLPLFLCVLVVLAGVALEMLLSWGHWDDPVVSRFSLPLQMAFSWAAMYVAATWLRGRSLPKWVLAAVGIYAVAAAAPVSSAAYMTNQQLAYTTYTRAKDYIDRNADDSILLVTRANLLFTLYNHPNISVGVTNHWPEKVANVVRLGFYREVWVIQEMAMNKRLNTWVEYQPSRIDQRLMLETIVDLPNQRGYLTRISRVVGYDPTKAAGTVVLEGEIYGDTAKQRQELGWDYTGKPTDTDNLLSERPEGEPAIVDGMETIDDFSDLQGYLNSQLPY